MSPPELRRPAVGTTGQMSQRCGRDDGVSLAETPDNLRDLDEARRDGDVAVLRRELLRRGVRRPGRTTELLAAIVAEADGGPRVVVVPPEATS